MLTSVPRGDGSRVDPTLARFLSESPLNRPAIYAFIKQLALTLPPGARVLDAGAGEAPYRTLFHRCDYTTSDWQQSQHPSAHHIDVVAPLDRLPLDNDSFDAVLSTEVLEHVSDPAAVLQELGRVLVPGGELWLTVPFVWELHEEPHDYFRYTIHGLRSLLSRAGFHHIQVEPLGGYFSTLAQLLRHCGPITGLDHRRLPGRIVTALVARTAPVLARLDRLDTNRGLPLGYLCRAKRPTRLATAASSASEIRSVAPSGPGERSIQASGGAEKE
jgi:SAM-dependent methyltransferase